MRWTCVVAASLLIGCSSTNVGERLRNERDSLIRQGTTKSYADGYVSGCSTAKYQAGYYDYTEMKEKSRYRNDEEYTVGWDHGFENCSIETDQTEAEQTMWDSMKK